MRIISGRYKGKIISAPPHLPARPTTDFAKTGLFNMLSNRIAFDKIAVLDLFCGTGNISCEFFSRGTEKISCVDNNRQCANFISSTFKQLNASNVVVFCEEAFSFLKKNNARFDIIFSDPPFDFNEYEKLIDAVVEEKNMPGEGIFVLEHQSKISFSGHSNFTEERKYGNVKFSFFKLLHN